MEGLSKEELLYDERAERLRQIRAQRQRKMRKRRHIRNFFLLVLLAGIVLYFVSDLSKVHSLSVSGISFTAMRRSMRVPGSAMRPDICLSRHF